jgi:hypothetical protein
MKRIGDQKAAKKFLWLKTSWRRPEPAQRFLRHPRRGKVRFAAEPRRLWTSHPDMVRDVREEKKDFFLKACPRHR